MAQDILGDDVLPTLEVDAHGLLLDCRFVGLPGQIAFFEQAGNPSAQTGFRIGSIMGMRQASIAVT